MNEYVNQAMAMMQKVIAAATPIAVKAWEISLLTLQIDALATIVPLMVGLVVTVVVFSYWIRCTNRTLLEMTAKSKNTGDVIIGLVVLWGSMITLIVVLGAQLLSVWLWVKLFMPELWLAHMAIEKLVK